MPVSHALILSSGGLRSLVATALVLHDRPQPRVTLLHVLDGREARTARRDHARRQADAFGIDRVIELDLSHLYGHGLSHRHAVTPDGRPAGRLAAAQLLTAAMARAALIGADRLVWPASFDGDADAMARATEQALLCGQLGELEPVSVPTLETPLLEFTDTQVLEIGTQLGVSWYLAWSCQLGGDHPCAACDACRRRAALFERVGLQDPAAATAARL